MSHRQHPDRGTAHASNQDTSHTSQHTPRHEAQRDYSETRQHGTHRGRNCDPPGTHTTGIEAPGQLPELRAAEVPTATAGEARTVEGLH